MRKGSSINYVVGRGGPPPHVVDYGNFFWSCFIQCWVWGYPPPYRSRNVVDYMGGGVPPTNYVVYGRSLRMPQSLNQIKKYLKKEKNASKNQLNSIIGANVAEKFALF